MKSRRSVVLGTLVICMALLFGGCDPKTETGDNQTGTNTENRLPNKNEQTGDQAEFEGESWAYNHEPGVEILRLGNDGKAVYKGKSYQYEKDDNYLNFHAEGDEVRLRYAMKKDNLVIYEKTVYHYVSGNASEEEPLVGLWQGGEEDRLSYEFTQKGTYLEDGVFPGHYLVDAQQGTIKLMYNDHFEDTYIYYSFEDGKLVIEYPWPLVRTQEGER